MATKKTEMEKWLELEELPPRRPSSDPDPDPFSLTDEELHDAICRSAISKNIDPNDHGVIPNAEIVKDENPVMAYEHEMRQRVASTIALTFGMSASHAEHAIEDALNPYAAPETRPSTIALARRSSLSELERLRDQAIREHAQAVTDYEKWLKPFAGFALSLIFASALNLGLINAVAVFIIFYGIACKGFTPKQKALKSSDS
jgi:hypothetical protein